MKKTFEVGDHCEGIPWEYEKPYRNHTYGDEVEANTLRCPHAVWVGELESKHRSDGSIYGYQRAYEIPEAATLFNECGYNSTVLCLACLDEARAANYGTEVRND